MTREERMLSIAHACVLEAFPNDPYVTEAAVRTWVQTALAYLVQVPQ